MGGFRISDRAHADLDEIWLFIAPDSVVAADRHSDTLLATIRRLGQWPGLGRPRPELGTALRSFPVGDYVIFYRPFENGIEIVRVLHGARDIPTQFA